ncbi:MAG: pantetheine-phosphate adenylyltransferase [Chloroflexi bacterium]|nr:pantetheine-phosphate adenylyltransferase [Chloroflexota bacterium]
MTTAVYPGSFDPVTHGHVDIATRAAVLFDEVVVGVYDTPPKNLLFTTQERADMFRKAVAHLKNVRVTAYTGLTVDFAQKTGARVIVRGLRMISDFEREFEMALMNKKLAPGIELVCLMSSLEYQFLSSSLLKEVYMLHGDIDSLVPPHVAEALREKFQQAGIVPPPPRRSTPAGR